MTTRIDALHFDIERRPARPRRDWRRALRALRGLLREPDRTFLAFEVVDALDPGVQARSLGRMLAQAEGRRVFASRASLADALCDRRALEQMPEGSFGRAYLAHVERYGLEPRKLVELGRQIQKDDCDPDERWMAERSGLTHDLWHVLTGYGADQIGEATLLLFSLAQSGGRGNALLAFGASLRVLRKIGPRWVPYAWTAWRRGRRATCLQALPYERLLPLPLSDVRLAAGVDDPERAHPGGVLCANPIPGTA